jgi:hypothetical protein
VRRTAPKQFRSRAHLPASLVRFAPLPARTLLTVSVTNIQYWLTRNRMLRSARVVPCSGPLSLAQ